MREKMKKTLRVKGGEASDVGRERCVDLCMCEKLKALTTTPPS